MFLSAIRSFRPMSRADRDAVLGINLHYIVAEPGLTFASLAETSPLKDHAEPLSG
jgi:hypothetical protein